jgi:hypothetical protein
MEEHGCEDEVARERKLLQTHKHAPMVDEEHNRHGPAEVVVCVLTESDCGSSGFLCMRSSGFFSVRHGFVDGFYRAEIV